MINGFYNDSYSFRRGIVGYWLFVEDYNCILLWLKNGNNKLKVIGEDNNNVFFLSFK